MHEQWSSEESTKECEGEDLKSDRGQKTKTMTSRGWSADMMSNASITCNINIPPLPPPAYHGHLTPSFSPGVGHLTNPPRGGEFDRSYIRPNASKVIMLNDFSEQDIASVTEWLTKNRLQKLRDAFELNYKMPFCNFNTKKGQMVLIAYWFWN